MSQAATTARESLVHPPVGGSASLRNLYGARFGFAVVWAGLLAVTASTLNPLSVILLVLYPLFDLGSAAYDLRTSEATTPSRLLYVNMALSLLAVIGIGVAATSGVSDILRVWGAWAVTAGIIQLLVGVQRYRLGGQWPMILSGAISIFAGAGFIVMSSSDQPSLTGLSGYATLGGLFFLASAVRLHRAATRSQP